MISSSKHDVKHLYSFQMTIAVIDDQWLRLCFLCCPISIMHYSCLLFLAISTNNNKALFAQWMLKENIMMARSNAWHCQDDCKVRSFSDDRLQVSISDRETQHHHISLILFSNHCYTVYKFAILIYKFQIINADRMYRSICNSYSILYLLCKCYTYVKDKGNCISLDLDLGGRVSLLFCNIK